MRRPELLRRGVDAETREVIISSLEDTGQAAYDVHKNLHQGKVGVLCLATEEGLGVRNPEMREQHLDAINRFRGV